MSTDLGSTYEIVFGNLKIAGDSPDQFRAKCYVSMPGKLLIRTKWITPPELGIKAKSYLMGLRPGHVSKCIIFGIWR